MTISFPRFRKRNNDSQSCNFVKELKGQSSRTVTIEKSGSERAAGVDRTDDDSQSYRSDEQEDLVSFYHYAGSVTPSLASGGQTMVGLLIAGSKKNACSRRPKPCLRERLGRCWQKNKRNSEDLKTSFFYGKGARKNNQPQYLPQKEIALNTRASPGVSPPPQPQFHESPRVRDERSMCSSIPLIYDDSSDDESSIAAQGFRRAIDSTIQISNYVTQQTRPVNKRYLARLNSSRNMPQSMETGKPRTRKSSERKMPKTSRLV